MQTGDKLKCRDCDYLKVIALREWHVDCECLHPDFAYYLGETRISYEIEMQDKICMRFTNEGKKEEEVQKTVERKSW